MRPRVVLGIASVALAQQTAALVEEDGNVELAGVVTSSGELLSTLEREQPEVVLVHEDLDPMPVMEFARSLTLQAPDTALVIMVNDASQDMFRRAMQAGARGVVGLPLVFDDLSWSLNSAAEWASTLKERHRRRQEESESARARMVCVAGSKGGVGTTTVALHLAMQAAAVPKRSVCLVDFDLQTGDIRLQLDIDPRRTVTDLVEVSGELTSLHFDETLFPHPSGLRILLSPSDGERSEEVSSQAATSILGGIRSRFDVVIVDVGSVMTEASAVALDMADEALVVSTPDVPSLRAVTRLTKLWDRLEVAPASTACVLNKTDRSREIQADFAKRVLSINVHPRTLPDDFTDLEAALNAGDPAQLGDGGVAKGLHQLAGDLGLVSKRSQQPSGTEPGGDREHPGGGSGSGGSKRGSGARSKQRRGLAGMRADRGAMSVEFSAVALMILVVTVFLWQVVLVSYTFVLVANAAQEGSQAMATGADVEAAATANLPDAWHEQAEVEQSDAWVEVRLGVPVVVPQFQTAPLVTSRMGTVIEDDPDR